MKPREIGRYLLNVQRISFQYDIKMSDVVDYVHYLDYRKCMKGEESDLEKSLNAVESWLEMKKIREYKK